MRRVIDNYPSHRKVHLAIGEGNVYAGPTVVRTVLGSCVSVTFFSPAKRIGAIFSWKDCPTWIRIFSLMPHYSPDRQPFPMRRHGPRPFSQSHRRMNLIKNV